jgi:hypothetical protein
MLLNDPPFVAPFVAWLKALPIWVRIGQAAVFFMLLGLPLVAISLALTLGTMILPEMRWLIWLDQWASYLVSAFAGTLIVAIVGTVAVISIGSSFLAMILFPLVVTYNALRWFNVWAGQQLHDRERRKFAAAAVKPKFTPEQLALFKKRAGPLQALTNYRAKHENALMDRHHPDHERRVRVFERLRLSVPSLRPDLPPGFAFVTPMPPERRRPPAPRDLAAIEEIRRLTQGKPFDRIACVKCGSILSSSSWDGKHTAISTELGALCIDCHPR